MNTINIEELKKIIKFGLLKQTPNVTQFSVLDLNQAAVEGLCSYYNINKDMSYRDLKKANINFSIVEEVIDKILPEQLQNIMGGFVETKEFGRDEEVKFVIKNLGKKRNMLSVQEGARGGNYKAHMLDDANMFLTTRVYTAAVYVSLEDILLGRATLGQLMEDILLSLQHQIYTGVVKALRAVKTKAPAANIGTGAGWVPASVDPVIKVIKQYGTPIIFAFNDLAVKISNAIGTVNPNITETELLERRNNGIVSVYKSVKVVEIPNYILDEETNATWAFSESDAFILPTAIKPVYVAMKGEGVLQESADVDGGIKQNYHKMMGIGILMFNNLGIYTDTEIS